MSDTLSRTTVIFGLNTWVVSGIIVGVAIVFLLFFLSLCLTSRRVPSPAKPIPAALPLAAAVISIPQVPNEIPEIVKHHHPEPKAVDCNEGSPVSEHNHVHVEIGSKEHNRISCPGWGQTVGTWSNSQDRGGGGGGGYSGDQAGGPEVSHLGWGHWYTLRELKRCTGGFDNRNVIGEGGYGVVYYGVLDDGSQIAVKNLLNNRGQAEREFRVEVEAIGRVRHKNLVRLLGYGAEGAHRMLVYEYVNNGNLELWLHGDVGRQSPLTWEIRMKIILGMAKGLSYLHEGLEPKVVHRDITSSNILLDKQWNPKVSDFGLAKLLGSDNGYVTTRVMGTFGYVAPEYASTGMLNERSDIYSFGILIMEIISGRNPVDYSRAPEEVNLVDWLKKMVTEKNSEGVLDPKLPEMPNTRALKRVLLVALKCVDPTAQKRPKMGHVVHMLEPEESSFKEDRRTSRETTQPPVGIHQSGSTENTSSAASRNDDAGEGVAQIHVPKNEA
ncbi:hypothetical protein MLD38_003180 [Melastoma candidum]|uniref:Uncharacterized protein n=1 Tax=Melastoma candidum TaxID=119954 RepID=A0ACB9S1J1_9MYRT|nr:hypothetical protein MLD38_003180 [Melastoma candidum]